MKKNNNFTPQQSGLIYGLAIAFMYVLQLIVLLGIIIYSKKYNLIYENVQNSDAVKWIVLLLNQVAFLLVVVLQARRYKVNLCNAMRLNFKLNAYQIVLILLTGMVALFGLGTLNIWLDLGIDKLINIPASLFNAVENIVTLPQVVTPFQIFLAIAIMVVIAPIVEEFLFRGVILNGLANKSKGFAIIISALMFAVMHGNVFQFIYQFLLGIILAYVCLATGSILAPILIHMLNNFINVMFMLYNYSPFTSHLRLIIFLITGIILLVFLLPLIFSASKAKLKKHCAKTETELVPERPSLSKSLKTFFYGYIVIFKKGGIKGLCVEASNTINNVYFSKYLSLKQQSKLYNNYIENLKTKLNSGVVLTEAENAELSSQNFEEYKRKTECKNSNTIITLVLAIIILVANTVTIFVG